MRLAELPTPCAVVDLDVVEANTRRMSERAARLGVRLRPHVKTHKTAEAARLSVRGHFGGVTVSTLREAEVLLEHGVRDLTWAVPLAPPKADAALALAERADRLHLLVDGAGALEALEAAAARRGTTASAFLKVDCGYHRAGVDPAAPEAHELARRLARSERVAFAGLLTHAGHAYLASTRDELAAVAEEERRVIVDFAEDLRAAGVEVPVVSLGSTPTCAVVEDLAGVDEIRPGNYVFFDLTQAALGACREEDVALSVLATVIGVYPERRTFLLDAGALALGKDPGATHLDESFGLGRVVAPEPLAGVRLTTLSQEHGEAVWSASGPPPAAVGDRVRVLPNHSCLTAALHAHYHVVRGDEVVDRWVPARGW